MFEIKSNDPVFIPIIDSLVADIGEALWEYDAQVKGKPNYSEKCFKGVVKLFISALMDKMWELQEHENMDFEDRSAMAVKLGKKIRRLIKVYTNIDMYKY